MVNVNFVFTLLLVVWALVFFAYTSSIVFAKPKTLTPTDEQKATGLQAVSPTTRKTLFILAAILAGIAVVVLVLASIQFVRDRKRPTFF